MAANVNSLTRPILELGICCLHEILISKFFNYSTDNMVQLDAIDWVLKQNKITTVTYTLLILQIVIVLHLYVVEEMLGLYLGED